MCFDLEWFLTGNFFQLSASVNLPLHHKVQKFSSGTGSPGWSRKKGRKTVVVWWWWLQRCCRRLWRCWKVSTLCVPSECTTWTKQSSSVEPKLTVTTWRPTSTRPVEVVCDTAWQYYCGLFCLVLCVGCFKIFHQLYWQCSFLLRFNVIYLDF